MNVLPSKISALVAWLLVATVATGYAQPLPSGDPPTSSATSTPDPCLSEVECKSLVSRARILSQASQFEAALVAYQNAYARHQLPWLLLNIGRIQQRLGHQEQAVAIYQNFLTTELAASDAEMRKKAESYLAQAQSEVAKQKSLLAPPAAPVVVPQLVSVPQPASSPQPVEKRPIYKRWWFWTILGVVVAGGVAGGLAAGLAVKKSPPPDPIEPGAPVFMPTF